MEAVIALSIAFVAKELITQRPGERRLPKPIPGSWHLLLDFFMASDLLARSRRRGCHSRTCC